MNIGLTVYGDLDYESGGFRYDRRLRDGLEQAGDTVTVIQLPWRTYVNGLIDNIRPSIRNRLRVDVDVMLQDELAHPSLVRRNRHLPYPRVSIIHHLRASESCPLAPIYRRVESAYLQSVNGAICTSSTTKATVQGLTNPSLPTEVAQPAGDRFDPTITPATITDRAQTGPLRLVFLGNLIPRKGLDTLITAIADATSDWELTVIGNPENKRYAAQVYRQLKHNGLLEKVTITGGLSDQGVQTRLRDSHVFAMPSEYEGFGIAYLEAMSFGLPVIATRAGGASDIVTHGETGFLIEPSNPSSITLLVDRLADNRDELARMGIAARTRYESHPDWSTTIEQIRRFLHQIADTGEKEPQEGGTR